jgi:uncharacterized membrane protein YdjX (TVP38/TMEM64 family)
MDDGSVPPRRGPARSAGEAASPGPAARWRRPVVTVLGLVAAALAARGLGLGELVRLDGLDQIRDRIAGAGPWGPVVYVAGYALAELLFVPGLPLTVLGGVAFGPWWGTVWVSAGSTLGAALAFLLARHALRGTVERWIAGSPRLARLDAAVEREGWRILVVTRLVPLFPFNLQNFAYGLTRIPFWRYVALSWLCMLPGTAAYTMAAGALVEGRGMAARPGVLLGAAALLVGTSLVPRWLGRRRSTMDPLGPAPAPAPGPDRPCSRSSSRS